MAANVRRYEHHTQNFLVDIESNLTEGRRAVVARRLDLERDFLSMTNTGLTTTPEFRLKIDQQRLASNTQLDIEARLGSVRAEIALRRHLGRWI